MDSFKNMMTKIQELCSSCELYSEGEFPSCKDTITIKLKLDEDANRYFSVPSCKEFKLRRGGGS